MSKYISERRGIIVFAISVMVITMIPYLIGYKNQGDGWRFTGFVVGLEDGNSYLAKMLSGSEGNWLFRSPHSAEEQKGVIAYLPYILLGKLSSEPAQHEQLVVLYHSARVVFGFLAILASYDFISIYITNKALRGRALFLVVLGGGLGWVLVAINQKGFLGSLPLEFISPESFGFLGTFGFPHLAAARALFLWGLVLYQNKEQGYLAGILWLIAGFFQPMIAVIGWAVIGINLIGLIIGKYIGKSKYFDIDLEMIRKLIIKTTTVVLISAPIVIYTAYVFLFDPYFEAWAEQNRFPSPHFIHYLLAYGLVLPFSIAGIWKMINDHKKEAILLAGWLVISPILIYAPVITQRRLAEGIWVVLIIGLVSNYSNKKQIPLAVKGLSLLLLPSTLFILFGSILQTSVPSEPIFRKAEEVAVYEIISEIAPSDAVVLSSFEIGNNLPAWAPVRAVMGHGPETVGLEKIKANLSDYLDTEGSTRDCKEFFGEYATTYLFWGPIEKREWEIDPGNLNCLNTIYNKQGYTLFEVKY